MRFRSFKGSFSSEVDEQSLDLSCAKALNGLTIKGSMKTAEEGKLKAGHLYFENYFLLVSKKWNRSKGGNMQLQLRWPTATRFCPEKFWKSP